MVRGFHWTWKHGELFELVAASLVTLLPYSDLEESIQSESSCNFIVSVAEMK